MVVLSAQLGAIVQELVSAVVQVVVADYHPIELALKHLTG